MTHLSPTHAEAHLQHVAQQFAQWRQTRRTPRGYRIPDPLWTEALALAEVLSVPHVAKQLHLKPQALKRRRGETAAQSTAASLQFVEVTPASGLAGPVAVEVQRSDGARLRITYSESTPALAPLLRTFLEVR